MTRIWCSTQIDEQITQAENLSIQDHYDRNIGYMTGRPVARDFPPTTIAVHSDHPPDDYFMVGAGMPIISERIKSVLDHFQVNAEFIPVRIVFENAEFREKQYWFMNVLEMLDVLDRNRGQYTYWSDPQFVTHVDKIKKLAIDEEKAADRALFRIAKGAEYIIAVNDALAESLSSHGITGLHFVKPEAWTMC